MASVKVVEIVSRVEDILQDANVRWPRLEIQRWLNDAYKAIVLVRPDANAVTVTMTCAAGTLQNLLTSYTAALRLLRVTRNMATTSNKKSVRLIDQSALDISIPDWHTETNSVNIQFYTFDDRFPTVFYTYPPATTAAQLEVVYSSAPTSHAMSAANLAPDSGATDVILLPDVYAVPIIDYILHRSFQKDAGNVENRQRSADHYASFTAAIGAKTNADVAAGPKVGG